jgi:hypothetical protein
MVGEVAISYTVKELLARIEDRQIRMDVMVGQLVTQDQFTALERIVNMHEARWNRVLGAAIAVAAMTGGAAGWITTLLSGG